MTFTREVSRGGQVQLQKVKSDRTTTHDIEAAADTEQREKNKRIRKDAEKTISELDELLDDIDSVLEENAEEFVQNYVQKGGE